MSFADRAALAHELESNLKHGRAFVQGGEGVAVLADCVLRVVHPEDGAELALKAQAVMVCEGGPMRGIGLQLRPFDATVIARLEAFLAGVREAAPAPEAAAQAPAADAAAGAREPEVSGEHAGEDGEPDDDDDDEHGASDVQNRPAHLERIRKLSQTEQQKVARSGDLHDRVTLERVYGKHVWEGLLHNPKLTLPEVARIARKGTMPRPLLEYIVENNAWIQAPIVRRALLGNPRISSEAIMKLLRITPKQELRVIYKTTTYSQAVRECARKVLDA